MTAEPAANRLPVELLEEIFTFASSSSRLTLSQVSRQFDLISTHLIYRDLTLTSPVSVVQCCRTLVSKPAAAAAVRSLSLNFKSAPGFLFTPFYELLGSALQALFNIHDLELFVPDLRYVPILVTCTFPRLHRFECYLSLCAGLASFLNRHPTIYLLQLSPRDRLTPDPNPPPVVLPALSYFIGNNECLMKVIGHASLRTAIVSWEVGQQTVEECIAALEKSSANSLKVLSCRRRGWNIDLVDTVSTRLPDLLVLSITNLLIVDQPSDLTTLAFERYLSRFTSLKRLLLHNIDLLGFGSATRRMDHDFATVTAWGLICPSLVECTLPYGLQWSRIRANVWWPDPTHTEGSSWLLENLYKRGYPEWGKVADVFEVRVMEELQAGKLGAQDWMKFKETIAKLRRFEELMDQGEGE